MSYDLKEMCSYIQESLVDSDTEYAAILQENLDHGETVHDEINGWVSGMKDIDSDKATLALLFQHVAALAEARGYDLGDLFELALQWRALPYVTIGDDAIVNEQPWMDTPYVRHADR